MSFQINLKCLENIILLEHNEMLTEHDNFTLTFDALRGVTTLNIPKFKNYNLSSEKIPQPT